MHPGCTCALVSLLLHNANATADVVRGWGSDYDGPHDVVHGWGSDYEGPHDVEDVSVAMFHKLFEECYKPAAPGCVRHSVSRPLPTCTALTSPRERGCPPRCHLSLDRCRRQLPKRATSSPIA